MFPLPCMLVCANCAILGTRDRGCSVHPAFPAPSLQEREAKICKARATHAARRRTHALSPRRPGLVRNCARAPGPICGRPPCRKSFSRSDRIACIHMSGLLVRLVTAGQDGFPRREFQTRQRPLRANGSHGVSRTSDRLILPSAPLAAPHQSKWRARRRPPTDLCYAACANAIGLSPAR